MKRLILSFCTMLVPALLWAQLSGWVEDFNDNTLTGWYVTTEHERTFQLAEEDSVLKITYTRTDTSWEWDNFSCTPPQPILVTGNPLIYVQVKSDINTQLTFKPIYANGSNDWLQENIPGDNDWHDVEFELVAHGGSALEIIYMYLDGGSTTPSSGTVHFDNLRIGDAAIEVRVLNLEANATDSTRIDLSWSCNYPELVGYYKIYRSSEGNFTHNISTFIDTTSQTVYSDTGFALHQTYYYKVTAMDNFGVESAPSNEVIVYTSRPGEPPEIAVLSTNTEQVGLYEKFEAILLLQNTTYGNPFDPEEIDVRTIFTSPTNQTWEIFGFYDNYQSRDEWKVRFAPDEIGTWTYSLQATDIDGTGSSEEYTFEAVESEHHGWLKMSTENPHYLMHDDSTAFYGVGVSYPWGVNDGSQGLAALEASGANMFYYWNITYSGEGNLIESLDSGLGKYDQPKCGRIDEILEWSEVRDLKMVLSIWPHDILSETVWDHIWHLNPYNQVCDAAEFYGSEEAWVYQEKQYRYLIARWGHSRSMGIWESVCEINGTDGWAYGNTADGLAWVGKVHDFFKQNDPYGRPTTASQSGGRYWIDGYGLGDLPNVHLYETGWTARYSNDPLRSSLWIYGNVAQQLWQDFEKPGIFGEAGYFNNYGGFNAGSPDYINMYHNALWVSWANGLAATPLWWDFGTKSIFTSDLMDQMYAFSEVVKNIDYAHHPFEPSEVVVTDCDAYAMVGDTVAFGWIRDTEGIDVSSQLFSLEGLSDDAPYSIMWLNPWTGDTLAIYIRMNQDDQLVDVLPEFAEKLSDMAYIARPAESGDTPERLELFTYPTILPGDTMYSFPITCFVLDAQDRLCTESNNSITFNLDGPGTLEGTNPTVPTNGIANIIFTTDSHSGTAQIIANSSELIADTLNIVLDDITHVENTKVLEVPVIYHLFQNFPNPFNNETIVQYALPVEGLVNITVYNTQGQVVDVLVNQEQSAGIHQIRWNAKHLTAGIYFYQMKTKASVLVQKCILLK